MIGLRKSWKLTTKHLLASRSLLPDDLYFEETKVFERQFDEYLDHNELGLALDCAEQMGILCNAPDEFWQELEKAALNMGLEDEAKRFRDIQDT